MKKKLLIIIVLCLVLFGFGISVLGNSKGFDFFIWGNILKQNSNGTSEDGDFYLVSKEFRSYNKTKLNREDIYAIGKDIILTKNEVSQATQFYELNGAETLDQTDAERYMMTYNAMYLKALQEGYYADEDSVKSYVAQLKEMFTDDEAKAALKDVMSGFESEDAYWEYEEVVYKKSLPIQNYGSFLQSEYVSKNHYTPGSEEFFEEFLQWKDQYQQELMEEQNFVVIHEGEEIPDDLLAAYQ